MGKLNCICGHEYRSTWPALYLLTEQQLNDLCDKLSNERDVESRDVLTCPKCGVLAIQTTTESVIYQFYQLINDR